MRLKNKFRLILLSIIYACERRYILKGEENEDNT